MDDRSVTRGRPVWLMITARAAALPRRSQKVTVAVTPLWPKGRNDSVPRFESIDPSGQAGYERSNSSPASRTAGVSRSRLTKTIQPACHAGPATHPVPSGLGHRH